MEKLRNSSMVDKETVKEAVKEIQRALISSDVEVSMVLELSKEIEKEAFKDLPAGVSRREYVIKKTYDLLVKAIGGENPQTPEKPKRILMVGLFGGGKTTSTIKIAKYYSQRGKRVGVIAADTYRPAAFEQLKQLSDREKIPFYGNPKEKHAATVVKEGLKALKEQELVIVDSAGRSALDKELVKEIKEVNSALKPDYTFLVIAADLGQVAKKQAAAFHEAVGVNGVIVTKMDGSAKGGGALTACAVTKSPVYFIGTGEKASDLEEFNAQRYLSKIMGYGDLQGLLEKVKEVSEMEELDPEELLKGEFNLDVFYKQLKAARKMGPMKKVMELMGLSMKVPQEQMEVGEEKLEGFRVLMDSMTQTEMNDPEIINKNRIDRIAKGSGKKPEEVRELLKHFKQMKRMFKKFRKLGEMENLDEKKLAKMMKGMKGFGQKQKKLKIR